MKRQKENKQAKKIPSEMKIGVHFGRVSEKVLSNSIVDILFDYEYCISERFVCILLKAKIYFFQRLTAETI